MISKDDGSILFDSGDRLPPSMTRDDFLSSTLGRSSVARPVHGNIASFEVVSALRGVQEATVVISFLDRRLTVADIMLPMAGDEGGWENWSLEREMERKAAHDALLRSFLGDLKHELRPPRKFRWKDILLWLYQRRRATVPAPPRYYKFPWGDVMSVYDAKGAFSVIRIRYRGQ